MLHPDRETTRGSIVVAAFEEIYRRGYQAASLGRILDAAGVTKGALYHYFRGKQELGYAVVDEVVGPQIRGRWLPVLAEAADPIAAIDSVLSRFTADPDPAAVALGCPLNNLAQEMSPLDEGFRARVEAVLGAWRGGVEAALRRGQAEGLIRPEVDPAGEALHIVATIEGCFGIAKNARSAEVLRDGFRALSESLQTLRNRPEPEERDAMEFTPHRQTWDLYAKAWSRVDEADRRTLLERSVDPACVYTDPLTQRHGHGELTAALSEFQGWLPGGSFRTSRFVEHNGRALADWDMVDGEGNVVNSGTSYTRLGDAGRLAEMTGFFPTPG